MLKLYQSKVWILLSIVLFIASCGGGSGGSSSGGNGNGNNNNNNNNNNGNGGGGLTFNMPFQNDEGEVRRTLEPINNNPSTVNKLSANTNSPTINRSIINWNSEEFELRWATERSGVQPTNNGRLSILELRDNDSDTFAIAIGIFVDDRSETEGLDVNFEAGGANVSSIPQGSFEYNGNGYSSPRQGSFGLSDGEFTMNVNFSSATGDFRFVESLGLAEVNGPFQINVGQGTFYGNSLRMVVDDTDNDLEFSGSATIYGAFHNEGATGVSGIFYETDQKRYGGSFAGARQDLRSGGDPRTRDPNFAIPSNLLERTDPDDDVRYFGLHCDQVTLGMLQIHLDLGT